MAGSEHTDGTESGAVRCSRLTAAHVYWRSERSVSVGLTTRTTKGRSRKERKRQNKWRRRYALPPLPIGRPSHCRRAAYEAYLRSKAWHRLRWQVLARDEYRCSQCGSTGILHVHHLTYERFRKERLEDLLTLCESCHRAVHQ
jgi:hypothetical protein